MNLYNIEYHNHRKIILHFGIGLIGMGIYNSLLKYVNARQAKFDVKFFPIHWTNFDAIEEDIKKIFFFLKQDENFYRKEKTEFLILWSAGFAGFSANNDMVEREFMIFKHLLDFLLQQINFIDLQPKMIFFSSGGGIFEGAGLVKKNTKECPMRPYGWLKQKQEKYLLENEILCSQLEILRPSTVYSKYFNSNNRLGLIGVLISNALKNKATNIYGNENTLRDYVCNENIGDYVVKKFCFSDSSSQERRLYQYLIAGKPTSIFELKKHIEGIINRKPLINYSLNKNNSRNIVFDYKLKPKRLKESELLRDLTTLVMQLRGSVF